MQAELEDTTGIIRSSTPHRKRIYMKSLKIQKE
jgi:hypothetical protein